MRAFDRRIRRLAAGQGGFTVAEVFIAVALMVMASMGLLSLFNSSIQLSGISKDQKDAVQYAAAVSERIKSLPFYSPYSGENVDIDDHFWGSAEQHGGDITNNNWSTNPEVDCTLLSDPRFACKVKMAYVQDDLTTSNMKSDWIPKAPEGKETKDRPLDANNKPINVIKFEVKVFWTVRNQGEGSRTSYSLTTLVTSTQVQANLGVTSCLNVDPSFSKWGTGGQNSNTAPHTAGTLQIRITGYGFKPTGNSALLVRSGLDDIPVTSLTYVDSGTLTGLVNLNTGGPVAAPWQPRRDPGRWTVKVAEGLAFAYGYDAFTVEFPTPVITDRVPVSGKDSESDKLITATGTNVLNLGVGPAPYTAYCGATIRLVKDDNPDMIIYPRDDMDITYGASGGYDVSNSVSAHFDFRNQLPGNYYVNIINCKSNRSAVAAGNTISANDPSHKFTISTAVPTPSRMYVTGSTPAPSIYVAAGEKRSFAYRNREYKYSLRIDGTELGAVDTVRIGINGDPATGTSLDHVITAEEVVAGDDTHLTCVADFKNVPESLAVSDSTYRWWVYCENSVTGAKGYATNAFMVRKIRPILYRDAVYSSGPGGVYHNYAPVSVTLYGECLESGSYNIKYKSGVYPAMADQAYVVGVSDGGMVKGSPTPYGTAWTTELNLIHCFTGANNIWVESNDATPATDNGFLSNEPRTYSFNVVVALPPGATLNSQVSGAVTISNKFHDYWFDWGWKDKWYGPTPNTETASAVANAQRSYNKFLVPFEQGLASFTLRGQGFVDAAVGSTLVTVSRQGGGDAKSGSYSAANPGSRAAADDDRVLKYLTVTTSEWQMPEVDDGGKITLGTTVYNNRFYIKGVLTDK